MKFMDISMVVLLVSFIILESKRGFAMTMIDFFGTIAAIKFTWLLYPRLQASMAEWFHLTPQGGSLAACAALFTLFILVVFVASKVFYDMTQLSLGEGIDSLFAVFLGIGVGIAILHGYLAMINQFGSIEWQLIIRESAISSEILHYYSYQNITRFLLNIGS
ncbi:MAG: CvpA family protein [bacterium]|nr:CvpA family protein [bacterium]